jgi:hypothetical protein
MVCPESPSMMLVKLPVPVPSEVLESAVVGAGFVLQHTPREVTAEPPSELIFPPDTAVVAVISVTALNETVGMLTLEPVVPTGKIVSLLQPMEVGNSKQARKIIELVFMTIS